MAISRTREKWPNPEDHCPGNSIWKGFYRQVITVIAEAAIKTRYPQLKKLLKASGFVVGPKSDAGKSSK
jgi:hypothetical protein